MVFTGERWWTGILHIWWWAPGAGGKNSKHFWGAEYSTLHPCRLGSTIYCNGKIQDTTFHIKSSSYLQSAAKTTADIETLAYLARAPGQNSISHLIFPKQEASSSHCEILQTDEANQEFTNFLVDNELEMIGWYHTHPSYESFLSSLDVHVQYRMQATNSNFFAGVYSGLNAELKHFKLNRNGMETVERWNCKLRFPF